MLDDRNLVSTGLGDMPSYDDVFSWSLEDQKHGDSSLQRCHCRQMQVACDRGGEGHISFKLKNNSKPLEVKVVLKQKKKKLKLL